MFEFFDGLLFDFFVPVLVVPDAFEELHQVNMLTYFLDSRLMNGLFDSHFPVDFFNHIFDISMGVGFDGLFVDEFFEVGHDDLDIDGWGFGLDSLEGFEAGGLKEVHFAEFIPEITNQLHDKFDWEQGVSCFLYHLLQDVRALNRGDFVAADLLSELGQLVEVGGQLLLWEFQF